MKDTQKIIQKTFLGVWIIILLLLFSGRMKSAHEFCPYSAICFGAMFPKGYIAFKITVIIGIVIASTSLFFSRYFCGYVCFFGTIQDLLSFRKTKIQISGKLHKVLLSLKYIVLLISIYLAFNLSQFFYMKFCPVLAISFPTNITIASVISLVLIFIVSIFIERFWCRYLCPYAAFMNFFSYIGRLLHLPRYGVYRTVSKCIDCTLCEKKCPMNITISKYDKHLKDPNCISCLKCIPVCPTKGLECKTDIKHKKV